MAGAMKLLWGRGRIFFFVILNNRSLSCGEVFNNEMRVSKSILTYPSRPFPRRFSALYLSSYFFNSALSVQSVPGYWLIAFSHSSSVFSLFIRQFSFLWGENFHTWITPWKVYKFPAAAAFQSTQSIFVSVLLGSSEGDKKFAGFMP